MPGELEILIRTLSAVVILFLMTKLLGKRQISQLSLFEYITGITIGNLAAYISLDLDAQWYYGLISIVVWVGISLLVDLLQLKSKSARDFIDTKTTVLIQEGKVLEHNLRKERITADELMQQLRKNNAFSLADVEFASIEPSGEINVLLTKENQPLTAKDLGLSIQNEHVPQIVIMDGEILDKPLKEMGLDRNWLTKKLEEYNVKQDEIYIAQVDSKQEMYVDLYADHINVNKKITSPPSELLALLKRCEADLKLYADKTKDKEIKQLHERFSTDLENVLSEMNPMAK
ncbi:DUF421 domain-containing protein [Paenibacillus arenosi]|uniref:DUF421 domain-containing protein n=1 Tax=Paenibacillus arenosi TaxID=2774142 RepID=A0ABR9B1E5_9BACL|nr:DUF421 domain-containing protein [Paenibacillus arenosi]MBD8500097.1 DUF421 domain-containing protein [Paenibacillus arenosi]